MFYSWPCRNGHEMIYQSILLQSFDPQSPSHSQNYHAPWYLRIPNEELYERSCQFSFLSHQTPNVERTRSQLRDASIATGKPSSSPASIHLAPRIASSAEKAKEETSRVNSTLTSAICCYTYTRHVKAGLAHLLVWRAKHLYACSRNGIRCGLGWGCWAMTLPMPDTLWKVRVMICVWQCP